jgi:four helix bundle protein
VADGSGKRPIRSFENLDVYRRLVNLHLEINELTMGFPRYEMHELGSQIRRSSNSIPPNLAEGWNNKHSTMYLESINRAQGELRETKHHLSIAFQKGHIEQEKFEDLYARYDECGRMLHGLKQSIDSSVRQSHDT